eukprot:31281-Pelagococcus_subviridis.AAC.1
MNPAPPVTSATRASVAFDGSRRTRTLAHGSSPVGVGVGVGVEGVVGVAGERGREDDGAVGARRSSPSRVRAAPPATVPSARDSDGAEEMRSRTAAISWTAPPPPPPLIAVASATHVATAMRRVHVHGERAAFGGIATRGTRPVRRAAGLWLVSEHCSPGAAALGEPA